MKIGAWRALPATLLAAFLAACVPGGNDVPDDSPYAPGVDPRGEAVDGVEVGNRLIAAGEYELAIKAFNRATLERGLDAEILSGLGTANLGLGRLGQAEKLLRRATQDDMEPWPEIWNNLGVVLMERGKTAEATQIFRKAYALDDGESTVIRDNLRLALANMENSDSLEPNNESEYRLVQRARGEYLIRPAS